MLGSVPAGAVAVYETNERTAAHFGELSATSLASRGCVGAVLDGGARDAEYILREDFPVFSRYVTPQDCVAALGASGPRRRDDRRRRSPGVTGRLDRRRPRRARDRPG